MPDSPGDFKQKSTPWRDSKSAGALRNAGESLMDSGRDMIADSSSSIRPVQFKTGGKVRKTGMALVHKGERVIPASKRTKVERLMSKAGMRTTNKRR